MSYRVGIGYDAHRLVPGRRLVLGGVDIPHEAGLLGHSDADVLSHAIGDALLGALGEGDLGRHFPPGDPRWKDASSLELLRRIMDIVRGRGARVVNVDAALVLEAPKVSPHVPAMRRALAGALEVADTQVSVKATTNEGMDAVGRGEGAAAHAVVLLELKGEV
jgi:2-C-methyl-D-erythritol 2,4-cyclodiphosphate synthase